MLLDDAALTAALVHFHRVAPFDAELVRVDRFAEHVWLAPEPRSVFVELIRDTCLAFPDCAPYSGAFAEPEPHLTVGQTSPDATVDEIARAAEHDLAPRLPVSFRVEAAWLLVEQADGTWVAAEQLPFES